MNEIIAAIDGTARLFRSKGRELTLGEGEPLPLDDAANVYWLAEGRLELFLEHRGDGEEPGARHLVLHLSPGSLLFGLDVGEDAGSWCSVAVGRERAILYQLSCQELAASDPSPALATAIDDWLMRLSRALSHKPRPEDAIDIERPGRHSLAASATASPAREVRWASLRTGAADYEIGEADTIALAGEALPISPSVGLKSLEDSEIEIAASHEVPFEALVAAVRNFNALALASLIRRVGAEEADHNLRLATRMQVDDDQFRSAIDALNRTIEHKEGLPFDVLSSDDPLFSASQMAAGALGVKLVRPHATGEELALRRHDAVQRIAQVSHVRAREVALKERWWAKDAGPLVAFRSESGAPVALIRRGGRYLIHDPQGGAVEAVTSANAYDLDARAYMFYRSFPDEAVTVRMLARFALKGMGRDIWTLLGMGLAGAVLGLLTPIATGILVDEIIPEAARTQLYYIATGLGVAALAGAMFKITNATAMVRIESRMNSGVQAAVWDRLLSLPTSFFRAYPSGDLAARAMGVDTIRQIISGSVASSIIGGLFSIPHLFLLFYYSWKLALVALLLVALAVGVGLLGGYLVLSSQRRQQTLSGELSHLVLQTLQGIGKVQASGAIRRAFVQWAKRFGRQNQLVYRESLLGNGIATFHSIFPVLSSICIFAFVAFYLRDSDSGFSIGNFLAFNAAFGAFLSASMQLAGTATELVNIVPLYERAKPILVARTETDREKTDPGELTGAIEVKHLYFRYNADQPYVLNDVSLSIRQGEFVAIIGPSGSGKSTLLRILLGFEEAERGEVYFDGRSLRHLDIRAVRRQIGVVLQNSQLIGGDIYSNIAGSISATMDEAWEAAKMAGLDKDIQEMPMGMQTFVSEGTGAVSGGQRQRLLIARALIKRPSILFFDEATSALDNPTQAIVSDSLEQIGATRVVVAHRLSTIRNADRIFVMDRGRIVEQGSYEELIGLGGLFSRLAERQLA